ncbi:MAG: hypothetical protein KIT34_02860 [Cyanobacteria bacterium TGS_CYA1]|nr:hypothetical protein [Cyanobacteria bacterium TGS_CYA1]
MRYSICKGAIQILIKMSLKQISALIYVMALTCGVAIAQPPLPIAAVDDTDKHAAFKGDLDSRARTSDGTNDRLTLDMVRDVGVSVRQIKDLSIYIFKEATRVPLTVQDPLELTGFDAISDSDFDSTKTYSPVRPGWIYFYISTLEPSIQLLKDSETQKVYIPAKIKDDVSTLSARFCDMIDGALVQIKKLHKCVDDGECDNKTVAECALSIYKTSLNMENLRKDGGALVQEAERKGYKDSILF